MKTQKYKFDIPLDEVFIAATERGIAVVNGTPLSVVEQKTLAVMLWMWMDQNAKNDKGAIVKKALEERWPDCDWK